MESTSISSKLLENVDFIGTIYEIIRNAGYETTQSRNVKRVRKECFIIKSNKNGVNRLSPSTESNKYGITYYPNDITIVGGAAFNLYDYLLNPYNKNSIAVLKNCDMKKTTDIDIVWWPRTFDSDIIITSESTAIRKLVKVFKIKLMANFTQEEKLQTIKRIVVKTVPKIKNSDNISVSIECLPEYKEHLKIAGIWTIRLNLNIDGYQKIKLCDIVIHDSGASQKYDVEGNTINFINFAKNDPVYSTTVPNVENSITYLNVKGKYIGVPNILNFIRQQMFAFDNLIREKNIKAFVYYKRVEYLKKLISKFEVFGPRNRANFKNVFRTEDVTYLSLLLETIQIRIIDSISKYYVEIVDLCRVIDLNKDEILSYLCEEAKLEPERYVLSQFKLDEINNLEKIKEIVKTKERNTDSEEYKILCIELQRKIQVVQEDIEKMSLQQLKNFRIKSSTNVYNTLFRQIQKLDKVGKVTQLEEVKEVKEAVDEKREYIPSIYILPRNIEFAPCYPPPTKEAPYYIEPDTGRNMRYDIRGFWHYLPKMESQIILLPNSIQKMLPPLIYAVMPNLIYT